MNPDELCICGHTYEVHFQHDCSRLLLIDGVEIECGCTKFTLIEDGIALVKAVGQILPYLPDVNDAKDYAATNEGRASSFQVAAIRLREIYSRPA